MLQLNAHTETKITKMKKTDEKFGSTNFFVLPLRCKIKARELDKGGEASQKACKPKTQTTIHIPHQS